MKHLKTFENYSNEETNESILGIPGAQKRTFGSVVKNILSIPITLLGLGITQLMSARFISRSICENHLDIYHNLDKIKLSVERMLGEETADLTDTELKKANETLSEIERVLEKYPTMDDFKSRLMKTIPKLNYRNKEFIRKKIFEYEPNDLSYEALEKILKKITKDDNIRFDSRYDNDEEYRSSHKSKFSQRLDDMLKAEQEKNQNS